MTDETSAGPQGPGEPMTGYTPPPERSRVRELAFWVNLLLLAGASFVAGRLADVSVRDPRAFVTLIAMVAAFLAVVVFRR